MTVLIISYKVGKGKNRRGKAVTCQTPFHMGYFVAGETCVRVNLNSNRFFFKSVFFACQSDSYSEADAKYTWKRGHVKSVERSPDISLPQMDLVHIQASENTDTYSTGKKIADIMTNRNVVYVEACCPRDNPLGQGCTMCGELR